MILNKDYHVTELTSKIDTDDSDVVIVFDGQLHGNGDIKLFAESLQNSKNIEKKSKDTRLGGQKIVMKFKIKL